MTQEHLELRLANLLLDRRQFLKVAVSVFAAASASLQAGCGGGAGSAGAGQQSAAVTGRVALPIGSAAAPASLRVVSGGSEAVPSASGQFNGAVHTPEPSLAVVNTASGDSMLMGFVDPQSNANIVDANSTAVALLFFAIGGPAAPVANKGQILQLLAVHAVTPPLAAAIGSRLAADPLALQNGDPQITTALKTAYTTLTANVLRSVNAASNRASVPVQRATKPAGRAAGQRAVVTPNELVQPTGQQSGVEVVQPDSVVGVEAINHFRRRAQMFVYRVSEVGMNGTAQTYPAAVLVGQKTDISATTALGLFTTLDNLFSGTTAFTPVTSPPVKLDLQPNSKQTNFEVVVIGASAGQNPGFFSDPKYAAASPGWIKNVGDLNLFTAIGDVALGFILELWGLRFVITDAAPIQAVLDGLAGLTPKVATLGDLLARARAGHYSEAVADMIEVAVKSDIVSSNMKQALRPYILSLEHEVVVSGGGAVSTKLASSAFRLISACFTPVAIGLGLGDLGAIAHDLASSDPGSLWTVNLVLPTFTLSPQTATITPGDRVTFSVKLPAGVTGNFEFDWTQNSNFATLSSSDGHVGNSLSTTGTAIKVDLVTTGSDTQPITVTVSANELDSKGNKTLFGTATALVTPGVGKTETASAHIYVKLNPFGNDFLFLLAFFTFPAVAGANQYVIDGATLTKTDFDKGAPVLDTGRNHDWSGFVPYDTTTNQRFYNLGGGTIGYLVDKQTPNGVGPIDPANEQKITALLQAEIDAADPTVTIT